MNGKSKLHVYQDSKGEWRWRLKAPNGRIVAESGEGYVQRAKAHRAALALIRNAAFAIMVDE